MLLLLLLHYRAFLPSPAAKHLLAGDDIVCRLGVMRLAGRPELTEEDVHAFELGFKPNLAIETFPANPENPVLTMGNRPPKRHRGHNVSDTVCIPPTEDGSDDKVVADCYPLAADPKRIRHLRCLEFPLLFHSTRSGGCVIPSVCSL